MEAILSTISGQGSSDDTWPFHSWHSSERCRVAQPALLNTRDTDWWLSHWATPLKHSFHWGSSSHIGLKIKHVSNHPRNIMEHHGILVSIFGMHNSWVSPNRRFLKETPRRSPGLGATRCRREIQRSRAVDRILKGSDGCWWLQKTQGPSDHKGEFLIQRILYYYMLTIPAILWSCANVNDPLLDLACNYAMIKYKRMSIEHIHCLEVKCSKSKIYKLLLNDTTNHQLGRCFLDTDLPARNKKNNKTNQPKLVWSKKTRRTWGSFSPLCDVLVSGF